MFDERKVMNNTIDYRLPIDSSIPTLSAPQVNKTFNIFCYVSFQMSKRYRRFMFCRPTAFLLCLSYAAICDNITFTPAK